METAFLIAPIGAVDSESRKRTDRLQEYVLEPSLRALNVTLTRADRINEPGLITRQTMEKIVHSDLVIADITEQNANVFYEMGIRHALRKPILHLRFEESAIPFDISDFRTISYNFTPSGLDQCIPLIREFCENSKGLEVKNPFSASTDSYLVIRGDDSFSKFRSLDIVEGLKGQLEQWRHLVSIAEPGVVFWTQAVGSTSFPEEGEQLMAEAVAKGATFKFILMRNPPFSGTLANRLSAMNEKYGGVEYVMADEADLRILGMSEVYALVSPRIDGKYGGVIIKDQQLIGHFKSWFDQRFQELQNE